MIKIVPLIVCSAFAQTRYQPESAEGELAAKLQEPNLEASHYKTFDLQHKFDDSPSWQTRSQLVVGYDSRGFISDVAVNTPIEATDIFTEACSQGKLYQLRINELDLLTSVNACLYSEHAGLNESLAFHTIDRKDFTSFSYEVIDLEYLASKEKRAKQKRLMLTPDFGEWRTSASVQGIELMEGNKPKFAAATRTYNSLGGEKVD